MKFGLLVIVFIVSIQKCNCTRSKKKVRSHKKVIDAFESDDPKRKLGQGENLSFELMSSVSTSRNKCKLQGCAIQGPQSVVAPVQVPVTIQFSNSVPITQPPPEPVPTQVPITVTDDVQALDQVTASVPDPVAPSTPQKCNPSISPIMSPLVPVYIPVPIAVRDDKPVSPPVPVWMDSISPISFDGLCISHPECKAKGLAGACCPNDDGIFEDCCSTHSVMPSMEPSSVLPSVAPASFEASGEQSVSSTPELTMQPTKPIPDKVPASVPVKVAPSTPIKCNPHNRSPIRLPLVPTPILNALSTSAPVPTSNSPISFDGSCTSNPECKAKGLVGACCPNDDGVFENCCSIHSVMPSFEPSSVLPSVAPASFEASSEQSVSSTPELTMQPTKPFPDQVTASVPIKVAPSTPIKCSPHNRAPTRSPLVPAPILDALSISAPVPDLMDSFSPTSFDGSCTSNPECKAKGFVGACCPNDDGVFEDCCSIESAMPSIEPFSVLPSVVPTSFEPSLEQSVSSFPTPKWPLDIPIISTGTGEASCSSNPHCVVLGLADDCCPTSKGVFLDCCGVSKDVLFFSTPSPSMQFTQVSPAPLAATTKPSCK